MSGYSSQMTFGDPCYPVSTTQRKRYPISISCLADRGSGWSFGKFPVISHLPKSLHCYWARIKNNPLYISKSTITHLYKADLRHERNMEIIFTKDIINFELCSKNYNVPQMKYILKNNFHFHNIERIRK